MKPLQKRSMGAAQRNLHCLKRSRGGNLKFCECFLIDKVQNSKSKRKVTTNYLRDTIKRGGEARFNGGAARFKFCECFLIDKEVQNSKNSPSKNTINAVWASLRQVQRESACTNKTINLVMKAIKPFFSSMEHKSTFVLDQQYSKTSLLLHGCVGCNEHVFSPGDKELTCPKCNHSRYNEETGKPNEVSEMNNT